METVRLPQVRVVGRWSLEKAAEGLAKTVAARAEPADGSVPAERRLELLEEVPTFACLPTPALEELAERGLASRDRPQVLRRHAYGVLVLEDGSKPLPVLHQGVEPQGMGTNSVLPPYDLLVTSGE